MSKNFSCETKVKYVNLILEKDFEYALISFMYEFENRYTKYLILKGKKRQNVLPSRLGFWILKKWFKKYQIGEMDLLLKNLRKVKKKKKAKKACYKDLCDNDLDVVQDILEVILEKKGVTHQDIMEEFRKRKEEIDIQNKKKWSEALGINRTSIYCKYTPVKKVKIDSLKNTEIRIWLNQSKSYWFRLYNW